MELTIILLKQEKRYWILWLNAYAKKLWTTRAVPSVSNGKTLQPSTQSFVLKFKSTLQSVFYTRARAILIVHKPSNSFYYYALPLRYWVLHLPADITTHGIYYA